MDVATPYKSIWFGDIHGPRPYEFIGSRATIISHTPASWRLEEVVSSIRPSLALLGISLPFLSTNRLFSLLSPADQSDVILLLLS